MSLFVTAKSKVLHCKIKIVKCEIRDMGYGKEKLSF
jgi:hypothetical protein